MISVIEADPALTADIDHADLPNARRATLAPVKWLNRGRWSWDQADVDMRGNLGLLVLDGLLIRRETIGALGYAELLGVGDLLRPWIVGSDLTLATVPSWEVIVPTRVAILDRDFALRAAPWPEIASALLDRVVMRCRSLSVSLAIHRAVRVEERITLMLWHLADRWGRVTPDGTVLPIALTHDSLGKLVGVRRSPVTIALGNLKKEGAIRRGPKGSWILSAESKPRPL